jgi:phosphoglycolate phosphatase-like HAD superfamily hydrolase
MAAIIFDFDGTIADSFDYVVDFLAQSAKLPPLDRKQKQVLRGHSMAAIGRGFGLSWWRLLMLFFKGRRQMQAAIKRIQLFEGMSAVIRELHADGNELLIVTSNTVTNVRAFLREHELQDQFSKIYGGVGPFGKAPALRLALKEHKLKLPNTVYIGDELRDVQAAQSLRLPVIAVTWGFARTAHLRALKPTALATTPAELIDIIAKL